MKKGQFVVLINDDSADENFGKSYQGAIQDVVDNWYTICCHNWKKPTSVLVQDDEDPRYLYLGGKDYGTKYKVSKVMDDIQFSPVKKYPVI